MTIDERLRSGLGVRPELTDSEIEGKLAVTIQRGRRRQTLRRAGLVVIGGVIALGLLVALPKLLAASNRKEPVGPPSPPGAQSPSPIVGTYTLVLGPRDPGAERLHAVGTWMLTFSDDGGVSLSRGNSVGTGVYRLVPASVVITGLFDACQGTGPGDYSWAISDGVLRFFSPSSDPCPLRRFVLLGPGHGHSWVIGAPN